ncbi:MAG: PhzF family phenazine biosynthesis protein [Verrucomicrobiota bacterium]
MKNYEYYLLDVFTSEPFGGNPLAVFPEGDDLSTETMQQLANELNLSESVFIQRAHSAEADCTLRIFTPWNEMSMAGHPTIGAAYTILSKQLLKPKHPERLTFDEGVGPIRVDYELQNQRPAKLRMHQNLPDFGAILEKESIAELLSLSIDDLEVELPVQIISCGVPFTIVPLRSLAAVQNTKVRIDLLEQFEVREILVFALEPERPDSQVHCRMFAPEMGVLEDPATGGAHGPLASYLFRYGKYASPEMVSEQGFEMCRPSLLTMQLETRGEEIVDVMIGGDCVEMGSGTICVQ